MKKYVLILADLEQHIREGRYAPGQKLPSVRSTASVYGCSISTVLRAYDELEQKHLIYSIPQSGYYTVVQPGDKQGEGGDAPGTVDLTSASPDLNVFPYLDFQHCLNQAIDTYKYHLFTYGDTQGLERLRRTLVPHLAGDQVFAKAERIMITSGVQQALEILARMPFPNGRKIILVEQPGYDIYQRYLETEGAEVRGISRSAEGIDLVELERNFRSGEIKLFYTMPRCQNPLGTSYSVQERKAIAALAGKYDVYIAEDDYMADLGFDPGSDPIYAYDRSAHTIYLKSFSKIIFPGLRLGAAVVPEALLDTFRAYKKYTDTSLLSQAALEIYIQSGMYERHKYTISRLYTERMALLNQALEHFNTEQLIEAPKVARGVYTHWKLPLSVNMDRLVKRLAARNILVLSGKGFYLSGYEGAEKFLRISISRAHPEQIEAAVQAIAQEVKLANRW
ncbi:PLP-dependent aminotransferase family protein [Paenibacillus donghaensis]|uniref:GntR family transcriptional regulator n=1 Tax=Paenibacillus donghaensis TaxID=414771 RepID=A0A2Z2KN47_9BACL|nr:PLP-dependent aminotransferase family protein [Paenibacillus donghaensis]ASA25865.1 GntR family transcriptional regulator [Paenibacillus donghaensis]